MPDRQLRALGISLPETPGETLTADNTIYTTAACSNVEGATMTVISYQENPFHDAACLQKERKSTKKQLRVC